MTASAVAAWIAANSTAIATTAAVASAAATVASGYQSYKQGKEQQEAYNKNADILRQNAARKRMETSLNEDIIRQENREKMSKARAAMAEAGMITSATTSGVLGQMGAELDQNALNLRYQGETEAANYMNQATMQNYYGKVAAAQGRNAFKTSFVKGIINGITTYMGVSSMASAAGSAASGSSAFVGGSQQAAQTASTYSRLGLNQAGNTINANGSLNFARAGF
jgi:hypothetical protein